MQVIHKRIQRYYSTGKELSPEEWEKLPTTKAFELSKVRNSIRNSYDLVLRSVEELASKGGFTFDALNIRLSRASGSTLKVAFQTKIDALKREERIGTMLYYDNIIKNVEGQKVSKSGKKCSKM